MAHLPSSRRNGGLPWFRMSASALGAIALCTVIAACGGSDSESSSAEETTPTTPSVAKAKNVIVMINDGAGWGTWDAAAYWQYGSRDGTPYGNFTAKYGMSTYPLNPSKEPTSDPASLVNYDKTQAWDTTATDDTSLPFKGYQYLNTNPTDSAAAGTALASGTKTFNNAINFDNNGNPVDFITILAKQAGKATGVITTVPFSHATPAAFGAQNISRNNYHAIASQMLTEGNLNLIMGAGAPGYNINGTACDSIDTSKEEDDTGCGDDSYTYLSESDWNKLNGGTLKPAGSDAAWTLIRSKADFEALASGTKTYSGPLIGSPNVAPNGTIQQGRQASITGTDSANPSGEAFIKTVPTLETMTRGAIQHLKNDPDGFFLMVEGGATDWAAHTGNACDGSGEWGNSYNPNCNGVQYGRIIEETQDFNNSVAAVVKWVEENSNWDETLLVVTTDHDNGMPMGPDAQTVPFQAVVNNGRGKMPNFSFRPTGNHSNALVPLWAKGFGSDGFAKRVRGTDENYLKYVGLNTDGSYVDNTDVHAIVKAALEGSQVEAIANSQ